MIIFFFSLQITSKTWKVCVFQKYFVGFKNIILYFNKDYIYWQNFYLKFLNASNKHKTVICLKLYFLFCIRKNTKNVDKSNVFVRDLLKAVLERFQRITPCQLNR